MTDKKIPQNPVPPPQQPQPLEKSYNYSEERLTEVVTFYSPPPPPPAPTKPGA